jgi:hypothetical protein
MTQYGWGLVGKILAAQDDYDPPPQWYRWDKEGSLTYWLRPDHFLQAIDSNPAIAASTLLLRTHQEITPRGSGGPSMAAPTSTDASKRSESGRTSSAKGYSAHGFSSGKAPTARGKCPKGHYWSYKKKKCVKSKFR